MAINWLGGCGQGGGGGMDYEAGENIQISPEGVISATDTTYSAGEGIKISEENVISALFDPDSVYTKEEVDDLIGEIETVHLEKVDALPAVGASNVIYLLPKTGGGYEMWHYDLNTEWADLGSTNVDLTDYSKKNETITNITRNGLTFTATRADGTSFTFTQQDNNTTYSATSPIALSGTTFSHANSGVSAGSYGPTANVNGSNGSTINVPQITVNATGHVTDVTNRVLTNVNTDTNTTYGVATASANGLMSAADKTKLNGLGARYTATKTVSVAASTATSTAQLTLPAGVYVVSHGLVINATVSAGTGIQSSLLVGSSGVGYGQTSIAVAGVGASVEYTRLISISSQTIIYGRAFVTVATSVIGDLTAVKIG